jgi:DNA polymerase V
MHEPNVILHPIAAAAIDPVPMRLPLGGIAARAGFPSPAEDFLDDEIDLHEWLVRNPPATFYYRAEGWSMLMDGICDGDTLIVDRSVRPQDGDLVFACWDGNAPVCKRLKIAGDHLELHSRNPHCPNIELPPGTEVEVFPVVGVCRRIVREGRRHVRPR